MVRSKDQVLNLSYKVNFKDFYTKLCVFSQIKDRKHIERNYHFVAWVIPQGWDMGCWEVKNFSAEICDGAPTTVRSSSKLE